MWNHDEWYYKGHRCLIEPDYEEDCVKAWHIVITPDGRRLWADISPYEWGRRIVNLWIDKGYPNRTGIGPLHLEDLEAM